MQIQTSLLEPSFTPPDKRGLEMMSRIRKLVMVAAAVASAVLVSGQEGAPIPFSEPADGGNLDVRRSTFDGAVAYLVPRWHESEALGSGPGARRWRNMLFALRGVKGKTVTFHLPARPPETGVMVHNMDAATTNLIEPVWSYEAGSRAWNAFTVVDCMRPDAADTPGAVFPTDSVVDNSGTVVVKTSSGRREDYGWVFRNTTPFTEDVVYVSINEHYPVQAFYGWLEKEVFTHPWVSPTSSELVSNTFLIGYQAGATGDGQAFSRTISDTPLYAFKIQDPTAHPSKVVMLVSGQHPYEGQTKAALHGALEWILDPNDPAAAAYRSEYVTLVYPFVNPTGELAGIWRGTAFDPRRDINRNWNTALTDPLADRGIDTVIIHKQAMVRDVAALGLGQPYAVVDLHQNFGDQLPALDYVLHHSNAAASAWVKRLQERVEIADIVSNPATDQTLRSFWQSAGAGMSLCIERSTYSTLATEHAFGRELMRTFVSERTFVSPAAAPVSVLVDQVAKASAAVTGAHVFEDSFTGNGEIDGRALEAGAAEDVPNWILEMGAMQLVNGAAVAGDVVTRTMVETGSINGAVEADVQLNSDQAFAGLVFRAVDRDNFYFLRIQPAGWTYGRVLNNTATTLASGRRAFAAGQPHALRAEVIGNTVVLSSGRTVLHADNLAAEPGATRVGLGSATPYSFSAYNFRGRVSSAGGQGSEAGVTLAAEPPDQTELPAGSLSLADEFSGEGTLQGRRPDHAPIGSPVWNVTLGGFRVDDQALHAEAAASRAYLDVGAADARVAARVTLPSAGARAGLVFRATDRDNFYYFRLQSDGWSFGRVVENTAYPIEAGVRSVRLDTAYELQAECLGTEVVLRINGRMVHRGNVEAPASAATGFGLASGTPVPFMAAAFRVDTGSAISPAGEGAGVAHWEHPDSPTLRLWRVRGPAGRTLPWRKHLSDPFSAVSSAAVESK